MEPWAKRFCALVFVFIALVVSMSVASALISWVYNVRHPVHGPVMTLVLWNNLSAPNIKPIATGLLCWSLAGFLPTLLFFAWLGWQLHDYQRRRWPTPIPPFITPRKSALTWSAQRHRGITLASHYRLGKAAPYATSVLLAGRNPRRTLAHGILPTLRYVEGPVLVVDLSANAFAFTAGWRAQAGHPIVHLAPFGGGRRWNPLRHAWTSHGWCQDRLTRLAQRWYPIRERGDELLASQTQHAFVTLVHALYDIYIVSDQAHMVSPVDLYQLCAPTEGTADRRSLAALMAHPALSAATRNALGTWLALDTPTIGRIWEALRPPLSVYAQAGDGASMTRNDTLFGDHRARHTTVYLSIPPSHRAHAALLVDTFIMQWHEQVMADAPDALPLVVLYGADTVGPLTTLIRGPDTLRWLATVDDLASVATMYGHHTAAFLRRFGLCVAQAPVHQVAADRLAPMLTDFLAAHSDPRRAMSSPATPAQLLTLRDDEQIVVGRTPERPVRCRVPRLPPKRLPPPFTPTEGEPMPVPKPVVLLAASMMAACRGPITPPPLPPDDTLKTPCDGLPLETVSSHELVPACLGPYLFRLPQNLFYLPWVQGKEKDMFDLSVQWDSLQPLPPDRDRYGKRESATTSVTIGYNHIPRLSDERFRTRLRRIIEPLDPNDPVDRANPSQNLDLRIQGEPIYGLTPYYADLDKVRAYYVKHHGPQTHAHEPEANEDWFVRFGPDGLPSTVITCTSHLLPTGAHVELGHVVDDVARDKSRALCTHHFLIPEYKVMVTMDYLRVMMPDWARLEAYARAVLKNGQVK
ncbi:hypothetical protein FHW69_003310 [Luteibacter sp. Sphag1AF]|uniref:type IV secretory system conjugative DNA transfer family protein n=1 Tax=Luteibacter sp. Sphag1AF TaxID=2587031 RepID=UPI00161A7C41|nr:type IV secretory system conjugative DNA transfer family protein [Luteibacter sp. Sphag1AF]MBB3228668.1 hypothetical protein [Luteibacter sp. Sphag1AF]